MIFILSRIDTIYTILIITASINDNCNFILDENNHGCYKLNQTRIDVYFVNRISIIDRIDTNFDKFSTNIYNIIEIYQIANIINNFCLITKILKVIQLIIHLIKTLHITTIITKELYLCITIYNQTPQITNKRETLTILWLSFEFCSKFNANADDILACHLIGNKMNNCNQYFIIINVIIINTIMYLIQTLFVIESQMIWKIALLGNSLGTRQTPITIHILTMNFDSFAMATTIVAC